MKIDTPNGILTGVQVIWDKDHGTTNEGWYVRSCYAGGYTEDDVVDDIQDLPRETDDALLISAAFSWIFPPDGLNDQEMSDLREAIEVRR